MLRKTIYIVTLAALTHTAFADEAASYKDYKDQGPLWNYVGTLSIGPVWPMQDIPRQTMFLTSDIEKTYTNDEASSPVFEGQLFLGIQMPLSPTVFGQIGFQVVATTNTEISGDIWDDALSDFNNYDYEFDIHHTALNVQGKMLFATQYKIIPWVSAAIGAAWNDAHGFSSTPKIFEAVPTFSFGDHTQTSFTYNLGAGFQYPLSAHTQVGVGYEFANWGRSKLSTAEGQTTNDRLTIHNLYTNGLLFNFTYLV